MFKKLRLKRSIRWQTALVPQRDYIRDLDCCADPMSVGVMEYDDHVEVTIDGDTIIMTYGQYATLYLSMSLMYGKL